MQYVQVNVSSYWTSDCAKFDSANLASMRTRCSKLFCPGSKDQQFLCSPPHNIHQYNSLLFSPMTEVCQNEIQYRCWCLWRSQKYDELMVLLPQKIHEIQYSTNVEGTHNDLGKAQLEGSKFPHFFWEKLVCFFGILCCNQYDSGFSGQASSFQQPLVVCSFTEMCWNLLVMPFFLLVFCQFFVLLAYHLCPMSHRQSNMVTPNMVMPTNCNFSYVNHLEIVKCPLRHLTSLLLCEE